MSGRTFAPAQAATAGGEHGQLGRQTWVPSQADAARSSLRVAPPDSADEREAARLSALALVTGTHHVEPGPVPPRDEIMRAEDDEEDDEDVAVQRSAVPGVPVVTPAVGQAIRSGRGGGAPLPASERTFFEGRFNRDLSGVRIHTDSQAADAARNLRAQAFTVGQHVYFGAGQPRRGDTAGRRLLAHELVHTIQNRPRSISRLPAPGAPTATSADTSIDAVATEVANLAQSDPRDQSGRIRRRLEGLDPVTRRQVIARARAREGGPEQRAIGEALSIPGSAPSATATPTARPRARGAAPAPPRAEAPAASAAPPSVPTPRRPAPVVPPSPPAPQQTDITAGASEAVGALSEQAAQAGQAATQATETVEERAAGAEQAVDAQTGTGGLPSLMSLLGSPRPVSETPSDQSIPAQAPIPEARAAEPGAETASAQAGTAPEDGAQAESTPPPAGEDVDVGAHTERIAATAQEARSRVDATVENTRGELRGQARSMRASATSQVERAHANTTAAMQAQRGQLTAEMASARAQITTVQTVRRTESMSQEMDAIAQMTALFTGHRATVDSLVRDSIASASTINTEERNRATSRTNEQVEQARSRGAARAGSYPKNGRGRVQADAARGVATEVAQEMESRLPETLDSIDQITTPLPDAFRDEGARALRGFDDGLPSLLEGIQRQAAEVRDALDQRVAAVERQLQSLEQGWQAQLTSLEEAAHARIDSIAPQVQGQIDTAERAADRGLARAARETPAAIDQIEQESVQILGSTSDPDPDGARSFTDGVVGYIGGVADESVGAITETGSGVGEQLQQARPTTATAMDNIKGATDGEQARFSTARGAGIAALLAGLDLDAALVLSTAASGAAEGRRRVQEELNPTVTELREKFGTTLSGARDSARRGVDEGLAKNDEGLRDLDGSMREAASDAAWDYDHPILSTLSDIGAFIAGAIVGILTVVAMVVVIIIAAKLFIAGFVAIAIALGVSAATALIVAKVVVAVGLLAWAAHGAYQAYSARRDAGQSVGGALLGGLGDLTGVTDIARAFTDESLSPYERGKAFGTGSATLVSTVMGGRKLVQRFTKRTPPTLPNPGRAPAQTAPGAGSPPAPRPAASPAAPAAPAPAAPSAGVTPGPSVPSPAQPIAAAGPAARAPAVSPTAAGAPPPLRVVPSTPATPATPAPAPRPPTPAPAPSRAGAPARRLGVIEGENIPSSTPRPQPQLGVIQGGGQGAPRPTPTRPQPARQAVPQQARKAAGAEGFEPVQQVNRPQLSVVRPGSNAPGGQSPLQVVARSGGPSGRVAPSRPAPPAPAAPARPATPSPARPPAPARTAPARPPAPVRPAPAPVQPAAPARPAAPPRPAPATPARPATPRPATPRPATPRQPPPRPAAPARPAPAPAQTPPSARPAGGGSTRAASAGGGSRGGGGGGRPAAGAGRGRGRGRGRGQGQRQQRGAQQSGRGRGQQRPSQRSQPQTGRGRGRSSQRPNDRFFSEKEVDQLVRGIGENGTQTRPNVTGGSRPTIEGVRVPSAKRRPGGRAPKRRKVFDLQDLPRKKGETPRQALARLRKVVGRDLSSFPELLKAWNDAVSIVLRNRKLTQQNARPLFEAAKAAFARRVNGDPKLKAVFEGAGLSFPKSKRGAPVLQGVRTRGLSRRDTRLSLDHKSEIRSDWTRALDPRNLRFEFERPNWFRELIQSRNPNLR